MALTYYSEGTATVAQGGTVVTFGGTASLDSIRIGDLFMGCAVIIAVDPVARTVTLAAPGWIFPALTASSYYILYLPPASLAEGVLRSVYSAISTGSLFDAPETTLASASNGTTDIGSAMSYVVTITGTNTITSFGAKSGKFKMVRFSGVLTLTHNATTLILLGGASRTTAAGDCGVYVSDASGNWRERSYWRAAINPGDAATKSGTETLSNKTFTGTTAFPSGSWGATGWLGVGTAAPSARIHAVASMGSMGAVRILAENTNAGGFGDLLAKNDQGTLAGFSIVGSTNTYYGTAGHGQLYVGNGKDMAIVLNESERARFTAGGVLAIGAAAPVSGCKLDVAGNIYPHATNSHNLGSASYAFANAYFQNAATITSDENAKCSIRAPSAAEMATARAILPLIKLYKMKSAVAAKGEEVARIHCGFIAQDIVRAFEANGLDPFAYGCVGFDLARRTRTEQRTVQRQVKRTITVRSEMIVTDEDGAQRLLYRDDQEDRPVWQTDGDGNDLWFDLLDENGQQTFDADGDLRRYRKPVMMEETVTDEIEEDDIDPETGEQRKLYNVRMDEIFAFVVAALADRLDALEAA